MKLSIAASLVAASIVVGIGAGAVAGQLDAPAPAKPATTTGKLELDSVVPGGIEPIMVGTSIEDAIKTGLVERDATNEACPDVVRYVWTGDLADALDLQVVDDGTIVSIGMFENEAETTRGASVGSSYAFLRKAYGSTLSDPEVVGYGQAGVYVREGSRWIGFMFDETTDKLTDRSRVSFLEVTKGSKPGLMRDGC